MFISMIGTLVALAATVLGADRAPRQQPVNGTVRVTVTADAKPVANAEVRSGDRKAMTSADGVASLALPPGPVALIVSHEGFAERTVSTVVTAGVDTAIAVELQARLEVKEEVRVTATRSDKRVQDEPLRVEVLGRDEIEEKLLMTPGDIAMLLSETTGLRVQVTSPGLGAASLRIQGLRGRYTQLLSDGLPLYGGQAGSIGLLQIPPMDLAQVEVIKGVASSLYGASALGGVVNLVSRKAGADAEHEVLVNQTSQGQTNALAWLSGPMRGRWGYTFLGGVDHQAQHDVDNDGWADLAGFDRISLRPRLSWDNGAGGSVFLTAGVMGEDRRGGTMARRLVPDGSSYVEALDTRRADFGLVARWIVGGTRVASIRGSFMRQQHRHVFGPATEHDVHRTGFGELSLTGTRGPHTWVVGGTLQGDDYRGREVTIADYSDVAPSVFAQDEFVVGPRLTLSGSVRVEHHVTWGTFWSPRGSALIKAPGGWTVRASGGTGFFIPRLVTEETEAVGFAELDSFELRSAERARSASVDANRQFGPVEVNATIFGSRVTNTLRLGPSPISSGYVLQPLPAPTRTVGAELLGRFHRGPISVVGTYTYVHATEPDLLSGVRGDVALTPRHSAGLTGMWEREGVARVGFEAYYTGRQALENNPYRPSSPAYPYFGALAERQFGRLRLFVNTENLTNRRQTRVDPLVRPSRNFDGRWTVDAWGPLEGRTVNAGVRVKF